MVDATCSAIAREHGEELFATASGVRSWLLVEQGGAWGPDALTQSRLPADVAGILAEMADGFGVRVLLLRRPEEPSASDSPEGQRCFLAYSGRREPWIEEAVIDEPARLLDIDLRALRDGRPVGLGRRRTAPLYLVCTNGRHDPCCAQLGRPVARALLARGQESVWECSHVGGDRFAGNLVCFPHGIYFGRLNPADGTRVVDSYEQGRIELDHYRGRAGDPFVVQAAEYYVRRSAGLVGIDDLAPVRLVRRGDDVADVRFSGARGRRFDVRVRVSRGDPERLLTCHATKPQQPATYELLDLRTG